MLSQTSLSADAEPRSPRSRIDHFLLFSPEALRIRYANSLCYRVRLLSVVVVVVEQLLNNSSEAEESSSHEQAP